jgi:replicative DNA helicase
MNTSRRMFLKNSVMALAATKAGAMGIGVDRFSKHEDDGLLFTGFHDFDQAIGGFRAGELVVIASGFLEGKTAFARNIMLNLAGEGKSVAVFSSDGQQAAVTDRLLACKSEIPIKKIFDNTLSPFEQERFTLAEDEISKMKIFFDYKKDESMPNILEKCRKIKNEKGLDLIIVEEAPQYYLKAILPGGDELHELTDRLREMEATASQKDNYDPLILRELRDKIVKLQEKRYFYASDYLKKIAQDLNVPLISLEFTDERMGSFIKTPYTANVGKYNYAASHADTVLFLHREDYHHMTGFITSIPKSHTDKQSNSDAKSEESISSTASILIRHTDDYMNSYTKNKGVSEIIIVKHPHASGTVYLKHRLEKYKFYTLGEG